MLRSVANRCKMDEKDEKVEPTKKSKKNTIGEKQHCKVEVVLVSPGELLTCRCEVVPSLITLPGEEYCRCFECLKPVRTYESKMRASLGSPDRGNSSSS